MSIVKIAAVNIGTDDPFHVEPNREHMIRYIDEAGKQGVNLLVFPELVLQGHGIHSLLEYSGEDKLLFHKLAEMVPDGESTQMFAELAKKYHMHIVWSMIEQDPERADATYNTSVLVGPEGFIGKYRKVHQPMCERFYNVAGDGEYPVFDTEIGKIGLQICFDKAYPEVARTLALKGAQIIANPICWPNGSGTEGDPDHKAHLITGYARAFDNMVVFVDASQCGEFMEGHSQILGPNPGQCFASAGFDEEMIVAEVDVEAEIDRARCVSFGGSDPLRDRKPGTYGELVKMTPYTQSWGGPIDPAACLQ